MRGTTKLFHFLFGTSRSARFRRSKHRTLNPLLQLPQFLGQRVGFVTSQARNRFTWIKSRFLRQVAYQSAIHIGMTINVLRDTTSDMFFICEHKAEYSGPLYLVLLLKRKPVFFFVHEIQQCATIKLRSRIAFDILRACVRHGRFYPVFISLNDVALEKQYRFPPEKTLTVPHPHHLAEQPAPVRPALAANSRLRIGIVETLRIEKPIHHLLAALRKARQRRDFQLVVGVPLGKKPPWLDAPDLEVFDTTTEAQFSRYLQSLDVFVVDFIKAEYYSRPSGALVDAGMNGCYVIYPDYPNFRAQIDLPTSVGAAFSSPEEIPDVLEKAIKKLQSEPIDFQTWRDSHRFESIASTIKAFLQHRGES